MSQPQQSIPDIVGVNMSVALARLAGNAKLLIKLFGDFRKQNLDTIQQIREKQSEGDIDTAVRLLHTLKGVAGNLAIDDLAEAARVAEHATKEKDALALEPAMQHLEKQLNAVCASIEAALAPAGAPPTPSTPAKSLVSTTASENAAMSMLSQKAMAETMRLVNQQSPDATFVFETIRADLRSQYPDQVERIAGHLDNYAFADAARELRLLAADMGIIN